ncbi:hypothetical protein [Actinophytocola gossypii]|uniref:Uncharacterized protein n=1 Tax=Actinophytocola gossypii TaxID=2812003 RepID=A0ABT2JK28_9PSEU|nr:hypothetical protein [Actinophytocola gossypii]MCT2588237.1 hypothetical protein [Actinophytocola gossypii]
MNATAGRGMAVLMGLIAVAAAFPPAVLLAREADGVDGPSLVALVVGPVVFLALRRLRVALSRRYVAACVARGSYNPYTSPAFGVTLVAWLVLVAALAVVASRGDLSDVDEADQPGLLALSVLGVLAVAAYFSWDFRRRAEIPALAEAGVVRVVEPPAAATRLRLRMWRDATLIEALFLAGALLPRLLPGAERPTEDDVATGVFLLVGGPAVISFVLLGCLLVLAATRRSAVEALRRPSSLLAIGLVAAGFALDAGGLVVLGWLAALGGLLLGSITCLNVMERGRQPWLGLTFLLFSYTFGYLTAPDGTVALPDGWSNWVVAVVAAGYAGYQIRDHWRKWHGLEPGRAPETAAA